MLICALRTCCRLVLTHRCMHALAQASAGQRVSSIASSYVGATSSRILKGLAAYGIGGVGNTSLRGQLGLMSMVN